MTVQQLIDKLEEYPKDMEVQTGGFDEGDPVEPVVSVRRNEFGVKVLMIDQLDWRE